MILLYVIIYVIYVIPFVQLYRNKILEFLYFILLENVMVEWLPPLLHIREVSGSNLGLEARYSD
jgi:hypothetical protein